MLVVMMVERVLDVMTAALLAVVMDVLLVVE